jgi:hypothetical protein
LAAVLLSSCGNAPAAKDGAVDGHLVISPPMGSIHPTNGTVTLVKKGLAHTDVTVNVGDSGRFAARVAPGSWTVTGRSPTFGDGQYVCLSGGPIVVTSNHRVSVSVTCEEK